MNEIPKTNGGEARVSDLGLELPGERDLRSVLRGALGEPEAMPDLTKGVQQKIRARSGGKFFADGWSTVKHPPINTYLVTSLMMLFVLGVIYALLAPLSGAPEPARAPKPVQVLPGAR
ncbi:MAG TPA: hypothetical protein VFQ61_09735 [Polyangiaceae bacterium]|nr:hypothetical protein [Polyangiaceae bacterium]